MWFEHYFTLVPHCPAIVATKHSNSIWPPSTASFRTTLEDYGVASILLVFERSLASLLRESSYANS